MISLVRWVRLMRAQPALQRMARTSVALSIGVWFVLDSGTSLWHGFAPNELRSRLVTEARHNDGTQAVVDAWLPKLDQAIGARASADRSASGPQANRPVMSVNFQTPHGELGFFSTFTTFGTPLDITVGSLRIEHLFPADEACDARWRALLST